MTARTLAFPVRSVNLARFRSILAYGCDASPSCSRLDIPLASGNHQGSRHIASAFQISPLIFDGQPAQSLAEAARRSAGDWIQPALSCFERVFQLHTAAAPGLAFIGAQGSATPFDVIAPSPIRLSAGGTGLSLPDALTSCLGEGLEFLSQVERRGDVVCTGAISDVNRDVHPRIVNWLAASFFHDPRTASRPVDWQVAANAATGKTSLMPADLCLRRSKTRGQLPILAPLSTGCAVGTSKERAATRAILELVERDAVALWWLGGRSGRPVLPGGLVATAASSLLSTLRAGSTTRTTWLLDLTTDVELPTIAALSADTNGRGLACGFAARLAPIDAARAAIFEMCQVETAFPLIEAKLREGGPSALNETDHRHLRRGALDVAACPLLHPTGEPARWPEGTSSLKAVVERLGKHGVELWLTDFSRAEYGVSAIRAFAPDLQPFPSSYHGERLRSVVENFGGGAQYTDGVDVM